MTKRGKWVFGIEATPVEEGDEFLVNPAAFQRGYICWKPIPAKSKEKAEKLGEVMVGSTEPLVMPTNIPPRGEKWDFQLGMFLKGFTGAAKGKDLKYTATSVGGTRAIDTLAGLCGTYYGEHAGETPVKLPVVTLASETYEHSAYGEISNPIITIERWIAMPKAEAVEAEPKKIARKARR
jgi:hypothetical protein